MYLLIILLPLLGSLTTGFFGHLIGPQGAVIITPICLFISFCFSTIAFYEVALSQSPCYFKLFT